MKAKPFKIENGTYLESSRDDATHIMLHMPGPFPNRMLPIILKGSRRDHEGSVWSWNGETETPTVKPSVKTWDNDHSCHTWINDGKVQFLTDCTHEFAGKTMDLLEVE